MRHPDEVQDQPVLHCNLLQLNRFMWLQTLSAILPCNTIDLASRRRGLLGWESLWFNPVGLVLGNGGMNGNEGYWGGGISIISPNFSKSPSILFHPLDSSISQTSP
jgi:hypothetical protein